MNACWIGESVARLSGLPSWGLACHCLAASMEVPQAPEAQPPPGWASVALGGVVGQALDGDDLAALDLTGRDQTGTHRHAVEADRAGAALALLAGVLRAGQPHALAQDVQQALALPHVVGLLLTAVDGEIDAHGYAAPSRVRPLPRYDSQVHVSVRRAMTPTAWRR